jgi:hypothetical protein
LVLSVGRFKRALGLGIAGALVLAASISPVSQNVAVAASKAAIAEPSGVASDRHFRLLTTEQYVNTLTYLFGADIKVEAQFAPLRRTDGLLSLGAARAGLTDSQLGLYQKIASLVAAQVVDTSRRDVLIPCKPASPTAADRACAAKFLSEVSRRLYRRQLGEARIAELVDDADKGADTLKDFYAGLAAALEGILVSPNVLFVAENSEPDPRDPSRLRLDSYSLASRLSLFLWNAAPDEMLR